MPILNNNFLRNFPLFSRISLPVSVRLMSREVLSSKSSSNGTSSHLSATSYLANSRTSSYATFKRSCNKILTNDSKRSLVLKLKSKIKSEL